LEAHSLAEELADLRGLAVRLRGLWQPLKAANAEATLWRWRVATGVTGGWIANGWGAQVMHTAKYAEEPEQATGPAEPEWTPEQLRERLTRDEHIEAHAACLGRLIKYGGVDEDQWNDFVALVAMYGDELLTALRPSDIDEAPVEAMQEAIRKHGKNAKASVFMHKCGIGRARALPALRELESRGEYHGFEHRPHKWRM
jgi:hypothetical protein